ncbi:AAA family ATPase, partial [Streptomyces sp. NPDC051940]|uniref:ATP-binding protein n=1 Tax=Streptomyces sp. NPDC051940 TaxID=3155675 RepID=UPI00342BD4B9
MYNSPVSSVFVGRADELRVLGEALTRAGRGEPQAVLVGGEAGVGKTRLLEEFLDSAAAEGAVVALGACVEVGGPLPYHPVSAALRALRRRLGDELDDAVRGQEGVLARLLPELGEIAHDHPDADGRARLFELTVRLLERLTESRTIVLALEDLHWADRSTRELLSYLLRAAGDSRLLIVATYRSDDLHRRHPLRPALAEYERLRIVRRIELPRFDRSEVRSQLAAITGEQPGEQLVDRIFDRSEGNAFFVEELACSLGEGLPGGLSDSLRDLLLVRIEALPEPVQRVVRIAAAGGCAIEYRLLATVTGLGEDELIDILRTAVGANVLEPCDDECFAFRHALLREAVDGDLLPGERSGLNRRYAEALQADPTLVRAEECAPRLAGYWYHAHDPAEALPATIRAAAASRGRHAYAEQLALLERALELWDGTPDDIRTAALRRGVEDGLCRVISAEHAGDFADLLAAVAVAARHTGERERALAIGKRALRLLDGDPSPSSRTSSRDPIRAAWFWTERYQLMRELSRSDGWEEIARAQELVRGLPPSVVHAEVLAKAAHWGALNEPGHGALTAARQSVELARMTGARDTELAAQITLGWLTIDSGGVEEGLDLIREVSAAEIVPGTLSTVVRSHGNLADTQMGIGRFTEAITAGEECIALAQRHGLGEVARPCSRRAAGPIRGLERTASRSTSPPPCAGS